MKGFLWSDNKVFNHFTKVFKSCREVIKGNPLSEPLLRIDAKNAKCERANLIDLITAFSYRQGLVYGTNKQKIFPAL